MKYISYILLLVSLVVSSLWYVETQSDTALASLLTLCCVGGALWLRHVILDYHTNVRLYNTLRNTRTNITDDKWDTLIH